MKWNTQLQNTQLIVQNLTSDSVYSNIEAYIQYGLRPHYNTIDTHLTIGYDAIRRGSDWEYKTTPIGPEHIQCLDCCYAISNYLWIRTNLYGNETNSANQLLKADKELAAKCPSDRNQNNRFWQMNKIKTANTNKYNGVTPRFSKNHSRSQF